MPTRAALVADVPSIARVHIASWRTTYRGLMPDEIFPTMSHEGRERQWRAAINVAGEGRGCVVVADEGEAGIVGFASGGPCRGDWPYAGELFTIYLAREAQGRGLGKGLFRAGAERLAAQGQGSLLLWVLVNNDLARGFYEALGGVPVGEKEELIGGVAIREVAYGWPEMGPLLDRLEGTRR